MMSAVNFEQFSIFEPVGTNFEHMGTNFEPLRLNLIHYSYRDSKTMYLYIFTLGRATTKHYDETL